MKNQITFKVDIDLKVKVKDKLKEEGRTLTWLCEKALKSFIDEPLKSENDLDPETGSFLNSIG